jgi:hypothetical protein
VISIKALLAASLCLLLCACNLVVTKAPVLSNQTRPSGVEIADGLWSLSDHACPIQPNTPVDQWPDCAKWFIVDKHRLTITYTPEDQKSHSGVSTEIKIKAPYYLADTQPIILQVRDIPAGNYIYLSIEPLAVEGGKPLMKFNFWPVQCGPLSMRGRKSIPYPGMRMSSKDGSCTTSNALAIVTAARLSRNAGSRQTASFVRALASSDLKLLEHVSGSRTPLRSPHESAPGGRQGIGGASP